MAEREVITILREKYNEAKKRADDLLNADVVKEPGNSQMVKRFSSKHGSKIFSAISTVLYASISIAKVDEVENLILRKGTSLPIGVFDLQEWAPYLDMARRCRTLALNEGHNKEFDVIKTNDTTTPNKTKITNTSRSSSKKDIYNRKSVSPVPAEDSEMFEASFETEFDRLLPTLKQLKGKLDQGKVNVNKTREDIVIEFEKMNTGFVTMKDELSKRMDIVNQGNASTAEQFSIFQQKNAVLEQTISTLRKQIDEMQIAHSKKVHSIQENSAKAVIRAQQEIAETAGDGSQAKEAAEAQSQIDKMLKSKEEQHEKLLELKEKQWKEQTDRITTENQQAQERIQQLEKEFANVQDGIKIAVKSAEEKASASVEILKATHKREIARLEALKLEAEQKIVSTPSSLQPQPQIQQEKQLQSQPVTTSVVSDTEVLQLKEEIETLRINLADAEKAKSDMESKVEEIETFRINLAIAEKAKDDMEMRVEEYKKMLKEQQQSSSSSTDSPTKPPQEGELEEESTSDNKTSSSLVNSLERQCDDLKEKLSSAQEQVLEEKEAKSRAANASLEEITKVRTELGIFTNDNKNLKSQVTKLEEQVKHLKTHLTQARASQISISKQVPPVDPVLEDGNSITSAGDSASGHGSATGLEEKIQRRHKMSAHQFAQRVVIMQSIIRRFIAKCRVRRKRFAIAAKEQGVLVAMRGTSQGKSGWYESDGNVYYFVRDRSDFILLAGPLSLTEYNQTILMLRQVLSDQVNQKDDIDSNSSGNNANNITAVNKKLLQLEGSNFEYATHIRLPKNISISRHAVIAARMQVDTLLLKLEDMKSDLKALQLRKDYMQELSTPLPMRPLHSFSNGRSNYSSTEIDTAAMRKSSEVDANKIRDLENSLMMCSDENVMLRMQMNTLQSQIQAAEEYLFSAKESVTMANAAAEAAALAAQATALLDVDSPNVSPRISDIKVNDGVSARLDLNLVGYNHSSGNHNMAFSPRRIRNIVKLQALSRGFTYRAMLTRLRPKSDSSMVASADNILQAMKGTQQGFDGWYCAPDGMIYFFALQKGEWIMVAGPLTLGEYIRMEMRGNVCSARGKADSLVRTPLPFKLSGLAESLPKDKLEWLHSRLYTDSKTHKLCVAVPIGELI